MWTPPPPFCLPDKICTPMLFNAPTLYAGHAHRAFDLCRLVMRSSFPLILSVIFKIDCVSFLPSGLKRLSKDGDSLFILTRNTHENNHRILHSAYACAGKMEPLEAKPRTPGRVPACPTPLSQALPVLAVGG